MLNSRLILLSLAAATVHADSLQGDIISLCGNDTNCINVMNGHGWPTEPCTVDGPLPCLNDQGMAIKSVSAGKQLEKRSWWIIIGAGMAAAANAISMWSNFFRDCYDGDGNRAYGGGPCARSATAALLMTGGSIAAFSGAVINEVEAVSKRDLDVGLNGIQIGPFTLRADDNTVLTKRDTSSHYANMTLEIDNVPIYLVHATLGANTTDVYLQQYGAQWTTDGLSKRDETLSQIHSPGAGLKYSLCHKGEHHLTSAYDWDDMWRMVDENAGDIFSSFGHTLGTVDMNDHVAGGWRVLMSSGHLMLEQSSSFGMNFEGCGSDDFSTLAR